LQPNILFQCLVIMILMQFDEEDARSINLVTEKYMNAVNELLKLNGMIKEMRHTMHDPNAYTVIEVIGDKIEKMIYYM